MTFRFRVRNSITALLSVALIWLGLGQFAHAIEPMSDVEKAAIIESEGMFPMKAMPGIGYEQRPVYWMSDTRALMRADKVGEWTKEPYQELDKVIVLDIERGKIEETPYRGAVNCYTPERMLLCVDLRYCPWKKGQTDPKIAKRMSGKFGSELEPIGFPEGHFGINQATCDSYAPPELGEKLAKGFVAAPMKNGRGYIGRSRIGVLPQTELAVFDGDGKKVWHVAVNEKCDGIFETYTPWDDGHFIGTGIGMNNTNPCAKHRVWKIDGYQGREIVLPSLFTYWGNNSLANVTVAWSKRGLLLYSMPREGDWDRLGLYWVDEGGAIRRLLKKRQVHWVSVAPDGCHVLINHHQGFLLSIPLEEKKRLEKTFETSVMNMCTDSQ